MSPSFYFLIFVAYYTHVRSVVIDSYSCLDSVFKVVILFLCRICSAGREVGIYVRFNTQWKWCCAWVCVHVRTLSLYSVQQCLIFRTRHKLFFFSYSADWWTPGSGARRLWRTRTVGVVANVCCVCMCVCMCRWACSKGVRWGLCPWFSTPLISVCMWV